MRFFALQDVKAHRGHDAGTPVVSSSSAFRLKFSRENLN
jgi:hypothetical protein